VPYIKESLEIIKHKIHQKLIKNIPAYTLTVLKNDYCATIKDKQKISLLSNPKEYARCQVSNRNRLENNESTTIMNLLYNADNYPLPKTQTKALKSFYTLKEEKQQELIAEFKKDKISSDILQTIYKKEGITGTLIQTMFV
jgi:predicted solute-binding protein